MFGRRRGVAAGNKKRRSVAASTSTSATKLPAVQAARRGPSPRMVASKRWQAEPRSFIDGVPQHIGLLGEKDTSAAEEQFSQLSKQTPAKHDLRRLRTQSEDLVEAVEVFSRHKMEIR